MKLYVLRDLGPIPESAASDIVDAVLSSGLVNGPVVREATRSEIRDELADLINEMERR